jgi:magnesium transporter
MYPELRKRAQKAGQPPGTIMYTGSLKDQKISITKIIYGEHDFHEWQGTSLSDMPSGETELGVTWINVEGAHNADVLEIFAKEYKIHPLTVEDIANVDQRPKVEIFDDYIYITLKMFLWDKKRHTFTKDQVSMVLGKNFLLTFQENQHNLFKPIQERLRGAAGQRLRQNGSDYLAYRIMDAIIDYYFVVLEAIGDNLEKTEEMIIADPKPQSTRTIYQLKHQLMVLRKSIWPTRELVSHLLQVENAWVSPFTRVYLRDLYDHVVQAIDTIETFRDVIASLLDIYLSVITNRMNEVMKVLTIIATIFIPITFITSLYGMNFVYMPELQWRWGYFTVLGGMTIIALIMLSYFRRKKWL